MSLSFVPAQPFDISPGTPVAASATSSAGGTITATLPGVAGMLTYISAFHISGDAVGSVVTAPVTVAGVVGGPLAYRLIETVSAGSYIYRLYIPALPATAANTAITVTVGSAAGGGIVSIECQGWQAPNNV